MKKYLKLAAGAFLAAVTLACLMAMPRQVAATSLTGQTVGNPTAQDASPTVTNLTVTGTLTTGSTNITTTPLIASSAAFTTAGGVVSVSSSSTSGYKLSFAGAFQSLPTSGYAEGSVAYQVSNHTLYVATITVTDAGCWKAAY